MKTIDIYDLQKKYRNNIILNHATYSFKPGKIHMIIGINGVGKTTLIKAILGLISYQGFIKMSHERVEYVPEKFIFPDFVTAHKFIKCLLAIKGFKISDETLDILLNEWGLSSNKYISKLSKGMRQKVLLIQALVSDSDVYVFDEPMNGLDKNSQSFFIEKLKSLKSNNRIIIITSHYPEIYKEIVDINVYLEEGKLSEKLN